MIIKLGDILFKKKQLTIIALEQIINIAIIPPLVRYNYLQPLLKKASKKKKYSEYDFLKSAENAVMAPKDTFAEYNLIDFSQSILLLNNTSKLMSGPKITDHTKRYFYKLKHGLFNKSSHKLTQNKELIKGPLYKYNQIKKALKKALNGRTREEFISEYLYSILKNPLHLMQVHELMETWKKNKSTFLKMENFFYRKSFIQQLENNNHPLDTGLIVARNLLQLLVLWYQQEGKRLTLPKQGIIEIITYCIENYQECETKENLHLRKPSLVLPILKESNGFASTICCGKNPQARFKGIQQSIEALIKTVNTKQKSSKLTTSSESDTEDSSSFSF